MDEIFRKAARAALGEWGRDEDPHDLTQDLWVWYLESPAVQEKLNSSDEYLARRLAYIQAVKILTRRSLAGDLFQGRNLYSSDSVKEALKGRSNNRYLMDILPIALNAVERQHEPYVEALRRRYEDEIIPSQGAEAMVLTEAHRALTEQVNIIVISAEADAEKRTRPGKQTSVDPDTRKASHGPSDPTGDTALALIEFGDDPIELVNGFTTYRQEFMQ